MDFNKALKRLQEADDKGDLLGSLKAQKSMLISLLGSADPKEVPSLMTSLSRTTADIIKQEGLSREVSDSDREDIADEDLIRRYAGVGGLAGKVE